jgi:hypothetical protein
VIDKNAGKYVIGVRRRIALALAARQNIAARTGPYGCAQQRDPSCQFEIDRYSRMLSIARCCRVSSRYFTRSPVLELKTVAHGLDSRSVINEREGEGVECESFQW